MSRIDDLLAKYCPSGVKYYQLWELTIWDKKFNGVDKFMQPQVIKYPYLLADDLFSLRQSEGNVFLLSTGSQSGWTNEELAGDNMCEGEIVAIPWGGTPNVKYYNGKFVTGDNRIATSNDKKLLSNKYLYYWLQNNIKLLNTFYRGAGIQHPNMKSVLTMKIPVPPLPVQQEIVRILDSFSELEKELEKELETREKQYEYYRNQLLSFGEGGDCTQCVEIVKLGMYVEFQNGFAFKSALFKDSGIPILRITNIQQSGVNVDNLVYADVADYKTNFEPFKVSLGDIVVALSGATTGKTGKNKTQITFLLNQRVAKFVPDETHILKSYLYHWAKLKENEFCCLAGGGAQPNLSTEQMKKMEIVIPSIPEQERIVSILDKFDALVNDISIGLPAEINARRKQYEYYRDKLFNF